MSTEPVARSAARGRGAIWAVALVASTAIADLLLKGWVESQLGLEGAPFLPFLSLRLHANPGISFGMFSDAAGVLPLIVVQAIGTLFVGWLLWKATAPLERFGFALIVGGAFGNLLDRAPDGVVTDFLSLHPFGIGLFTFNLADAFISIGVVMILIDALGVATRPRWRRL